MQMIDKKYFICEICGIGRSEKHKSWKCQNGRADSEPRHSIDFRTVFVIKTEQESLLSLTDVVGGDDNDLFQI